MTVYKKGTIEFSHEMSKHSGMPGFLFLMLFRLFFSCFLFVCSLFCCLSSWPQSPSPWCLHARLRANPERVWHGHLFTSLIAPGERETERERVSERERDKKGRAMVVEKVRGRESL